MSEDILLYTIFIPLIIGFFKQEVLDFYTDLRIYTNRDVDGDGDPATGKTILVQSDFNNYVEVTIVEYQFSILPFNRKVITLQKVDIKEKETFVCIVYTYSQWNNLIKGVPMKS